MPIDVTVEEPRTRIVGEETDGYVIATVADTHDIANHGIHKVVRRVTSAANYGEGVPMQVNRVLAMSLG